MSFVSSLNETPYALTFAGQATPWRAALDEIAHDPEIAAIVAGVIKASDQVLSRCAVHWPHSRLLPCLSLFRPRLARRL